MCRPDKKAPVNHPTHSIAPIHLTPRERAHTYAREGQRNVTALPGADIASLTELATRAGLTATQFTILLGWAACHPGADTLDLIEDELHHMITAKDAGHYYSNVEVTVAFAHLGT